MTLQEGPEADRRNPEVDILPGFDLQSGRDHDGDFDAATHLGHPRSREASLKTYVAVQNAADLEERRQTEHSRRDIKTDPNNQGLRTEMPPESVRTSKSQDLVSPEKEFVRRLAEYWYREQH